MQSESRGIHNPQRSDKSFYTKYTMAGSGVLTCKIRSILRFNCSIIKICLHLQRNTGVGLQLDLIKLVETFLPS